MNTLNDTNTLDLLVKHFGTQRLLAALPQAEVVEVLGLVTVPELAGELDVNYNTLRYAMQSGRIPYPQIRLARRAYYSRSQADVIQQQWNAN